jgi:hypothetical protein
LWTLGAVRPTGDALASPPVARAEPCGLAATGASRPGRLAPSRVSGAPSWGCADVQRSKVREVVPILVQHTRQAVSAAFRFSLAHLEIRTVALSPASLQNRSGLPAFPQTSGDDSRLARPFRAAGGSLPRTSTLRRAIEALPSWTLFLYSASSAADPGSVAASRHCCRSTAPTRGVQPRHLPSSAFVEVHAFACIFDALDGLLPAVPPGPPRSDPERS